VLQNLPDTPAGERYNQLAEAPLNEIQDTLFQNYGDYHQSRNLAMALHNLHQGNSRPRAYVLKWDTQLARIRRDDRPKDFMVVNYFIEGFNSSPPGATPTPPGLELHLGA
jgi:hypothetical protein